MDLTNVKIGDIFLRPMSHGWSRASDWHKKVLCESVTDKQCVIGGYKYRKSDARPLGDAPSIVAYDVDLYNRGQKFLKRKWVENFKYGELSEEAIDRICLILKEPKITTPIAERYEG